jgi:hypothetical protein
VWDYLVSTGASGYPVIVEWLGGILALGIFGAIGKLQLDRGKKDATTPATVPAEVAGAIIDKQTAFEILAGIDLLGKKIVDLASSVRSNTRAVNALREATDASTAASRSTGSKIEEASTDIRELTREIVRSGRS